jgi:hypothetical protein
MTDMPELKLSYRIDAPGCEEEAFFIYIEDGPDLAEVFVERKDEPLVAEIVKRYNHHAELVEALRSFVERPPSQKDWD